MTNISSLYYNFVSDSGAVSHSCISFDLVYF